MKTTIVTSSLLALGLAFGTVGADTLKPMQAYSVGPQDHSAVLYYTETERGYKVVTTWIANYGRGPTMRHIAYLTPGERYTLSLAEAGSPADFTIRSDATRVALKTETPDAASAGRDRAARCEAIEVFAPTPVQRLVLCGPGTDRLASR